MAWRIHNNVVRGQIDNREPGRVTGKIWLHGLKEPLVLDLAGNACPDLAGCFLSFENPGPTVALRPTDGLKAQQHGSVGDLTASRKVRVFDLPIEDALELKPADFPAPEHVANCVYLEWFSQANGRVVIESSEYQLTISAPSWRLSPQDEETRRETAAESFSSFMQKLGHALDAQKHTPPEDKEWDEFDYEKFMRESDARTDKYGELLDKYMDHPDRDRIIAREMGWAWLEDALDEHSSSTTSGRDPAEDIFAPDRRTGASEATEPDADDMKPDPSTEGIDWVRAEDGHVFHPLSLRALEGSVALHELYRESGMARTEDSDLVDLISEYQTTAAKLAGALDSLAYGRHLTEGAFIVAYLKRALSHLHAAQAALVKVALKNLLPDPRLHGLRAELFALREEILRLMEEFRGRKR